MEFERAIPILRILGVAKARGFHGGFPGMSRDWEHRFEPGLHDRPWGWRDTGIAGPSGDRSVLSERIAAECD